MFKSVSQLLGKIDSNSFLGGLISRFRTILILIFISIIGSMFLLLILRYFDIKRANIDILEKNYTIAEQNLNTISSEPILFYDSWRYDYNLAVLKFESGDYSGAINAFGDLKATLKDSSDYYHACMADMNIAYIYEYNASKTMKNTDNADNLRIAAKDFLDAFLLRNDINSYCYDSFLAEEDNSSFNNSQIDYDQIQYSSLIQDAYALDGKYIENEIDKMVDEFKKNNGETSQKPDNEFSDPRLKDLYEDLQSSQSDADKAKDLLKNRADNKVVRPW